jgi:hypothetical protein
MPLNSRNGLEEPNRIIDVNDPSVIVFDADRVDKFDRKTAQLISVHGTHERADDHTDIFDCDRGAQTQTYQASLVICRQLYRPAPTMFDGAE